MKAAVRYYTRSGNTEKLARAVAGALALPFESIDLPLTEPVDVLFLGCSYYAFDMDPQVKRFLQENRDKIGRVACFGTSAMMKSMKKPMMRLLKALEIPLCEEEFHCRGHFKFANKGRPNEEDEQAAAAFAV